MPENCFFLQTLKYPRSRNSLQTSSILVHFPSPRRRNRKSKMSQKFIFIERIDLPSICFGTIGKVSQTTSEPSDSKLTICSKLVFEFFSIPISQPRLILKLILIVICIRAHFLLRNLFTVANIFAPLPSSLSFVLANSSTKFWTLYVILFFFSCAPNLWVPPSTPPHNSTIS